MAPNMAACAASLFTIPVGIICPPAPPRLVDPGEVVLAGVRKTVPRSSRNGGESRASGWLFVSVVVLVVLLAFVVCVV